MAITIGILTFSDSQRLKCRSELESSTLKVDVLKSKVLSLTDAITNEQTTSDKIKSTIDIFKPAATSDAIVEDAIQKSIIDIQAYNNQKLEYDNFENTMENVIWSKLGKLLKPIPNVALLNVLNLHASKQIEQITMLAGVDCTQDEDDDSFNNVTIKAYAKHVKLGIELESVKRSAEYYSQQFCEVYNEFKEVVQIKMQKFDPENYDEEVIKGM